MRVKYKTANGRLEFEIEGSTEKELFRQLAKVQDVFEETVCKVCNSKDVIFNVRRVKNKLKKDCEYFESKCNKCGNRLAYGQNIEGGTLYPKRKCIDEKGEEVYDTKRGGWGKFVPDESQP